MGKPGTTICTAFCRLAEVSCKMMHQEDFLLCCKLTIWCCSRKMIVYEMLEMIVYEMLKMIVYEMLEMIV